MSKKSKKPPRRERPAEPGRECPVETGCDERARKRGRVRSADAARPAAPDGLSGEWG